MIIKLRGSHYDLSLQGLQGRLQIASVIIINLQGGSSETGFTYGLIISGAKTNCVSYDNLITGILQKRGSLPDYSPQQGRIRSTISNKQ